MAPAQPERVDRVNCARRNTTDRPNASLRYSAKSISGAVDLRQLRGSGGALRTSPMDKNPGSEPNWCCY
jgi:hypothetical protein